MAETYFEIAPHFLGIWATVPKGLRQGEDGISGNGSTLAIEDTHNTAHGWIRPCLVRRKSTRDISGKVQGDKEEKIRLETLFLT